MVESQNYTPTGEDLIINYKKILAYYNHIKFIIPFMPAIHPTILLVASYRRLKNINNYRIETPYYLMRQSHNSHLKDIPYQKQFIEALKENQYEHLLKELSLVENDLYNDYMDRKNKEMFNCGLIRFVYTKFNETLTELEKYQITCRSYRIGSTLQLVHIDSDDVYVYDQDLLFEETKRLFIKKFGELLALEDIIQHNKEYD